MSTKSSIIKIRYIRDNPHDEVILRALLEQYPSLELTFVSTLSEGTDLLVGNRFDLILLNLNLSKNDQLESLEKLSKEHPTVPIIIFCESNDAKWISETLAKGAHNYLLKSRLESEDLFKTINYTLERFRLFEHIKSKELESRQILNTVNSIIFKISVETGNQYRYTFVNQEFCDRIGKSAEEIEGKLIEEILPKKSIEEIKSKNSEAIAGKKTIQWEMSMDFKKGITNGIVTISPYFDTKGICQFIVVSVNDFTKVIKENAELAKSNAFLNAIFDQSLNAIMVADDEGNYIAVNNGAVDLLEYTKEELLQMNYRDLISPSYHDEGTWEQYQKNRISEGEFHFLAKSGKNKTALYNTKRIEKDFNISTLIDMTDRIEYQQEINKLSLIARNTINAAIITDTEGKTVWINESTTRITGYQLEEMIGKKPGDLMQGKKTDQAVVSKMSDAIANLDPFDVEVINYAKDG